MFNGDEPEDFAALHTVRFGVVSSTCVFCGICVHIILASVPDFQAVVDMCRHLVRRVSVDQPYSGQDGRRVATGGGGDNYGGHGLPNRGHSVRGVRECTLGEEYSLGVGDAADAGEGDAEAQMIAMYV